MKAAVIYRLGEIPQYADIAEPTPKNENELLISVKAAAVKNLDKMRVSGKHYSSELKDDKGHVVGMDGVGVLADGTRIYAMGIGGMIAEKALVEKGRSAKVPNGLDDVSAAALPNAVIGSAMGLKFKADIKPGDVVLVNGATGFTGKVAVQLAKHYGAKKVIATGRNPKTLEQLKQLGADEVVSVSNDDEFLKRIKAAHTEKPIDIILDYLWGHTSEMILSCLKGNGSFTNRMRYVTIGGVSGDTIQLSSSILRSIDLQLSGSGLGAWSKEQVGKLFTEILPETFQLAADGKLKVETVAGNMKDISSLWNKEIVDGKRLVITI